MCKCQCRFYLQAPSPLEKGWDEVFASINDAKRDNVERSVTNDVDPAILRDYCLSLDKKEKIEEQKR
jgi:hypothetical protein